MTNKMHISWKIIARQVLGKSSEEENKLIERWLQEDERNREYYERCKHYFDVYYTGIDSRKVDTESAWNEFLDYTEKSSRKIAWRKIVSYAAIVMVVLGVGITYWSSHESSVPAIKRSENSSIEVGSMKALLVLNSGMQIKLVDSSKVEQVLEKHQSKIEANDDPVEYNTLIVPKGGEFHLMLADGTSVKMNSDSKLRFPNKFVGSVRQVYLEGEALFDVEKDPEKAFVVQTDGGDIRVLGTVFNVNAYPEEAFVKTTLVSGKVAFRGEWKNDSVVIAPGEQVAYEKSTGEVTVAPVNVNVYTAWAEGKWIIEGERLEDIMRQLSRWYDVSVFYQNPEVKDLIFTGDLEKYDHCEVVLNIISMTTNVEFEIKDKTIIVKMK